MQVNIRTFRTLSFFIASQQLNPSDWRSIVESQFRNLCRLNIQPRPLQSTNSRSNSSSKSLNLGLIFSIELMATWLLRRRHSARRQNLKWQKFTHWCWFLYDDKHETESVAVAKRLSKRSNDQQVMSSYPSKCRTFSLISFFLTLNPSLVCP